MEAHGQACVYEERPGGDGSWSPDGHSLTDGLWRSGYSGQQMVTAYVAWSLAESGYRGLALDRALGYLARSLPAMDDAFQPRRRRPDRSRRSRRWSPPFAPLILRRRAVSLPP